MKQVKIIKKKDDYTMEYEVGDICKVTGTWYGGVHIEGKTGIPVSIDRDEYVELDEQERPVNDTTKTVHSESKHGSSEPTADESDEEDVPERDIEVGDIVRHLSGSGYLRRVQSICIRCLLLHSIRRMERSW